VCNVQLNVIRCLLIAPKDENWRKSSVFYTYITHKDKSYKVMIDGGSCVNIITKLAVKRMNLKVEAHHNLMSPGLIRLLNLSPSVIQCLFSF